MSTTFIFEKLIMFFLPFVVSIAIHEWAHIAMARYLGDDTGTRLGRFTLNPLVHIDPIWTVALPLLMLFFGGGFIFGAGKPAPYRPQNLDRTFGGKRVQMRTAEMLVAAAGPTSNMIIATFCIPILVALQFIPDINPQLFQFFLGVGTLNVVLAVFNLIPVDPLDGGKVIRFFLPYKAHQKYDELMLKGGFMLMILAFVGARYVLSPAIALYLNLVSFISSLF